MSSSKLVKGTFILTAGALLSKIIGVLYTAPFARIMGEEGGLDLYTYAYVPYTIFICIATAGLPSAISKFTAKYNAMGQYATSRRMFKSAQILMMITGFVAFAILFAIAPLLAHSYDHQKFSHAEIASVIRAVSIALIVVPSLSFFRGFFQGHGNMVPTSVSQVIEQIARVFFLLGGVFYAMKVLDGKIVLASQLATLGAFVGSIAAMLVLIYYWRKTKPEYDLLLEKDKNPVALTNKQMFKEIFSSSIPFIFVAVALPMFQLIDTWTLYRGLDAIGKLEKDSTVLSIINVQVQQLVLIPITLATSFQISIIPNISAAVTQGNFKIFKKHLDDIFTILLFILVPATIGMSLFASEFFTLFYGRKGIVIGAEVLRVYAPIIILFAMLTVTASILQGMNKQSFSVKSLTIGFAVKAIFALPCIYLINEVGAVVSSGLGYLTVMLLNLYMIQKHSKYNYRKILKRLFLMIIFSFVMVAILYFVRIGLDKLFDETRSSGAGLILVCAVPVGAVVYFALAYYSNLLQITFGPKVDTVMRKLRLKSR
ncbi:MAG: polysaccharide biosynthesis protein [Bacillales bacterium]|nr:polysaccharide biosynthesis protein [Bacillales bacterium]